MHGGSSHRLYMNMLLIAERQKSSATNQFAPADETSQTESPAGFMITSEIKAAKIPLSNPWLVGLVG